MNAYHRSPASTRRLSTNVRQLQLLLFSVLALGFFLSLASLPSTSHHIVQPDRADHLLTHEPFLAVSNDLLRAVRSDFTAEHDNSSRDQPALQRLSFDVLQVALLVALFTIPVFFTLHRRPVSSSPGTPRGPPVFSL
ncbi:MAG: hypothetical protein V4628_05330 [Pseudomonadota bacterium]